MTANRSIELYLVGIFCVSVSVMLDGYEGRYSQLPRSEKESPIETNLHDCSSHAWMDFFRTMYLLCLHFLVFILLASILVGRSSSAPLENCFLSSELRE